MSMSATVSNGPARKSLAEQIDRLDAVLDGLADGLNGAVALAVAEAVRAAVVEVLTSPQLHQRLHAAAGGSKGWTVGAAVLPAARFAKRCVAGLVGTAKAVWHGAVALARGLAARAAAALTHTGVAAATRCRTAASWAAASGRVWWTRALLAWHLAGQLRKPLALASGVGLLVGLGCYLAGPVVSSTVSGAAGFGVSLAASAWAAVRQVLARQEPQTA